MSCFSLGWGGIFLTTSSSFAMMHPLISPVLNVHFEKKKIMRLLRFSIPRVLLVWWWFTIIRVANFFFYISLVSSICTQTVIATVFFHLFLLLLLLLCVCVFVCVSVHIWSDILYSDTHAIINQGTKEDSRFRLFVCLFFSLIALLIINQMFPLLTFSGSHSLFFPHLCVCVFFFYSHSFLSLYCHFPRLNIQII